LWKILKFWCTPARESAIFPPAQVTTRKEVTHGNEEDDEEDDQEEAGEEEVTPPAPRSFRYNFRRPGLDAGASAFVWGTRLRAPAGAKS
jgi:hypothetical protein